MCILKSVLAMCPEPQTARLLRIGFMQAAKSRCPKRKPARCTLNFPPPCHAAPQAAAEAAKARISLLLQHKQQLAARLAALEAEVEQRYVFWLLV